MVKSFLVFLFIFSFECRADLFDFGSEKPSSQNQLLEHLKKLKALQVNDDPIFEDALNQSVKAMEGAIEEEKLYCNGEVASKEGKPLAAAQKQLCMRELKKNYLEFSLLIFDLKKKYLNLVHKRQIEKLTEIQNNLKAEIEKKF